MAHHLYRKVAFGVILLLLTGIADGQTKRMNTRTGPRAIAVLEVDSKNHSRLVPVTLIYETRFYDANLYQRNPVPMALAPDVVYDVLQSNERVGTFTTRSSRKVRDIWYGLGVWKSAEETERAGSDEEEEDERPVLRRSESAAKPSSEEKDETKSSPTPVPDDSDRPTLRRTVRGQNPTADKKAADEVMMTPLRSAAAPASIKRVQGKEKEYVAISDLQATDYRSMAIAIKPSEEGGYREKMLAIARKDIVSYAKGRGIKLPAAFQITDYEMRAFDADYSNDPQLVLTVSYAPPAEPGSRAALVYATVVARVDFNGDAQKLFSQVTDSARLGFVSRLELVDIVDAEGYQRGSLLFRQYTDAGRSFVLYRVDAHSLTKLFEGSSGE